MLRTGKEHLESLRDGRVVYVGSERVDDVTTPSGVPRRGRRPSPAIYDMKADPANRDTMTYEEDGGRHSIYFLRAEDPRRPAAAHGTATARIADLTFGMFGRSPDHVASFVTGMAMKPDALPAPHAYADNLLNYYRHIRDNDIYVVYAVVPPQAARNPEFYHKQNIPVPTLRVVREDDDGVVISGMKMLATGALYANEIWIGNVIPLAPDQKKEAITCAIPCNAPGLTLWSRKPAAVGLHLGVRFAAGLALRRERQHADVRQRQGAVGEGVRARRRAAVARHLHQDAEPLLRQPPVERALLVEDAAAARPVQPDRAAPPAPTRCRRCARRSARWRRSRHASAGWSHGQINACESWPEGYVCFNRRFMYAGLDWCTQNYSTFIDELRELCGGGVFQMPADISVMDDPELAKQFDDLSGRRRRPTPSPA